MSDRTAEREALDSIVKWTIATSCQEQRKIPTLSTAVPTPDIPGAIPSARPLIRAGPGRIKTFKKHPKTPVTHKSRQSNKQKQKVKALAGGVLLEGAKFVYSSIV